MPSLWITSRDTLAKISSERVVIKPITNTSDLENTRTIPLIDVDLVILGSRAQFSSPLIHALMKRNIPIFLMNSIGQITGNFLPPITPHGSTRLAQYNKSTDPKSHKTIAAAVIGAKIYNQRRTLQRIAISRGKSEKLAPLYRRFATRLEHLKTNKNSPDQILGIEGSASADFYRAWADFLPMEFPFERRSRRPPLNPVNTCISFISTLIYQEMTAAIFAASLDPALGHLHTTTNNRWSLALDLIEPFRPVIAEALTLDLFSRSILDASHFTPLDSGGIHLNHQGRKKLILHYEKRLERYFYSEHLGQRITLRQVIRNTPISYKKHLIQHSPLTPFRMN